MMAPWNRLRKFALLIVNTGFVCYLVHLLQNQRKATLNSLEVNPRFLNQEKNILQRLDHLDWSVHNLSKSVEAFHENINQIEHHLKLQVNSKSHKAEVLKADNAKEKNKIVHRLLYPDSPLFKQWGADLREEEQTVAQNLFLSYGYNVYLSDHLPLDRPIRDTRSPSCKMKTYPKDLPTLSVVLIFMNEALSVILRAITSIINRTPSHLLKEIILVDDYSSNDDLKGTLETHIKNYNAKHPGLLKIIRHQETKGLTQARISGWEASTADVVAILDAHIEVNTAWAEPILSRLKEDRTVIVSPVFDNIRFADFELLQYGVAADGFDWALWCLYEDLPAEWYALKDETAPIQSPSIMGILAADRKFLGEIGVLDSGMYIYGGENVELGLRAWQCGGRVEVLPCSRVGHVERAHKPYLLNLNVAMKRNALRVAEVWMDDYKYMVYFAWNLPIENPGIDFGDVSSRKQLRKKLNCKGFDWYIKNIYPNLVFLPNIVGYGTMKNTLKEDICIDQGPVPGNTPIMYPCHAYSSQHIFYHSTGEMYVGGLRARRNTADRCLIDPGNGDLPVLEQCDTAVNKSLNLHWDFTQGSAVINRGTKRCLEITADNPVSYRLVMRTCTGQRWNIQHTVKDWGRTEDWEQKT
ncbi:probable polypeptide N-acetylgalactosaminyltransferase 8 [Falco rusticolus]|uniref:probable polypeptide N-acetylgalactosaminyltransferase 8 n=1 Tax=Falco rusticolus TaxID=120794 RepID=UPI00188685E8|nr:probable polypeptide N-acetylgalactosaminyltransferase 8 [Falco rusticolus]XP_055568876.1 probable polypeptide N-acetylgalactosaminyltransferase 8 [Falco cherrug]